MFFATSMGLPKKAGTLRGTSERPRLDPRASVDFTSQRATELNESRFFAHAAASKPRPQRGPIPTYKSRMLGRIYGLDPGPIAPSADHSSPLSMTTYGQPTRQPTARMTRSHTLRPDSAAQRSRLSPSSSLGQPTPSEMASALAPRRSTGRLSGTAPRSSFAAASSMRSLSPMTPARSSTLRGSALKRKAELFKTGTLTRAEGASMARMFPVTRANPALQSAMVGAAALSGVGSSVRSSPAASTRSSQVSQHTRQSAMPVFVDPSYLVSRDSDSNQAGRKVVTPSSMMSEPSLPMIGDSTAKLSEHSGQQSSVPLHNQLTDSGLASGSELTRLNSHSEEISMEDNSVDLGEMDRFNSSMVSNDLSHIIIHDRHATSVFGKEIMRHLDIPGSAPSMPEQQQSSLELATVVEERGNESISSLRSGIARMNSDDPPNVPIIEPDLHTKESLDKLTVKLEDTPDSPKKEDESSESEFYFESGYYHYADSESDSFSSDDDGSPMSPRHNRFGLVSTPEAIRDALAPLKKKLRHVWVYGNTEQGMIADALMAVLNLVACVEFVMWVDQPEPHAWTLLSRMLTVAFLTDWVVRLTTAKDYVSYSLSWYGLSDLLSFSLHWIGLNGHFLRAWRVPRLLRLIAKLAANDVSVFRNVNEARLFRWMVGADIMLTMFLGAGLFAIIEGPHSKTTTVDSFLQSFYFTFCTVTTVGYGDIHPQTQLGRVVVMGSMVAAFVIVPYRINVLTMMHFELSNTHEGDDSESLADERPEMVVKSMLTERGEMNAHVMSSDEEMDHHYIDSGGDPTPHFADSYYPHIPRVRNERVLLCHECGMFWTETQIEEAGLSAGFARCCNDPCRSQNCTYFEHDLFIEKLRGMIVAQFPDEFDQTHGGGGNSVRFIHDDNGLGSSVPPSNTQVLRFPSHTQTVIHHESSMDTVMNQSRRTIRFVDDSLNGGNLTDAWDAADLRFEDDDRSEQTDLETTDDEDEKEGLDRATLRMIDSSFLNNRAVFSDENDEETGALSDFAAPLSPSAKSTRVRSTQSVKRAGSLRRVHSWDAADNSQSSDSDMPVVRNRHERSVTFAATSKFKAGVLSSPGIRKREKSLLSAIKLMDVSEFEQKRHERRKKKRRRKSMVASSKRSNTKRPRHERAAKSISRAPGTSRGRRKSTKGTGRRRRSQKRRSVRAASKSPLRSSTKRRSFKKRPSMSLIPHSDSE